MLVSETQENCCRFFLQMVSNDLAVFCHCLLFVCDNVKRIAREMFFMRRRGIAGEVCKC